MQSKRIRIYSPYYPYPITEGAFQVIFDQVRYLAQFHDVELVTWKETESQIQKKLNGVDPFAGKVRVIHWQASSESREDLARRFIRTLCSLFSRQPSPGLFYYPPQADRRAELGPCDLAIYHYTYAATWSQSGGAHKKERRRAVYQHNIESDLFELRKSRETSGLARWIHGLNAKKLRRIESELPELFDELWFISEKDRRDYVARIGVSPQAVSVRPPIYFEAFRHQRAQDFRSRKSSYPKPVVGFVGTLDFAPNVDSLTWILDHICPQLLQRGWQGTLLVAGRNPNPELLARLRSIPFLNYLGAPTEMREFWSQLDLMLVPHIDGSGVRIKLLDAVAGGVPTLANQAAVDRIDDSIIASPLLTVRESPREWAEYILQLPSGLRDQLENSVLPAGMDGRKVYSDLS